MKKTLVLASAVALLAGCAAKNNINTIDGAKSSDKTVEQRVVAQEATINKLNDQMELMGKNLIFLNKKVKSQEEMLNSGVNSSTAIEVVSESAAPSTVAMISGNLTKFQPSTFSIAVTTPVYNSNGDEVTAWNQGRRFTSYQQDGNFYKVSGYSSKGKRWAKTNQELYIPMENAQQVR